MDLEGATAALSCVWAGFELQADVGGVRDPTYLGQPTKKKCENHLLAGIEKMKPLLRCDIIFIICYSSTKKWVQIASKNQH